MKIKMRQGFVSNSSSASYRVAIGVPIGTVLADLRGELGFCELNIDRNIAALEHTIQTSDSFDDIRDLSIEELTNMDSSNVHETLTISALISKKTELNELKKARDIGKDEETIALLKIYGITIKEDNHGNTVLEGWTVMHNSYMNVPDIIKNVLLYNAFEHPERNILTGVEHDS